MGFSFDNAGDEPSPSASSSDAGPSSGDEFSWGEDSFSNDLESDARQGEATASGDTTGFATSIDSDDDDDGFNFQDGLDAGAGATPYGDVSPGSPPMVLLAAGAGLSVVGVVTALVFRQSWVMLTLGWLLAGPLAIAMLGQYIQKDSAQRARPIYKGGPATRHFATMLGALALASVVTVAVLAAGKVARAW